MVRLACFRVGNRHQDDNDHDVQSIHSASSFLALPNSVPSQDQRRRSPTLFPNKQVSTRADAKQRVKKILNNVKKDHHGEKDKEKHRPVDDDPEFLILAKIYSELDATVDLASVARNRSALSHLLPFMLNALLYGFDDRSNSALGTSTRGGWRTTNLQRDPKDITLGGTSHLVKAQCEKQLEQFLYEQAIHSVTFALECLWYFTGSLYLGPKESYHRTMTLLLGMESVVTNSVLPGDLFKKADLTGASTTAAASSSPTQDTEKDPNSETDTITPGRDTSAMPATRSPSIRQVDLDVTGSGQNDTHMQFNALKVADEAKLQQWLDARRERSNIFHAQLDFVKCLTHISNGLFEVDRELRRDVLRRELEKLNDFIPTNVYIPTERRAHRVLRIVPEDAHVFSTKERVPYLLVVEVEDLVPEGAAEEPSNRSPGPLRRIGSLGTPVQTTKMPGGSSSRNVIDGQDEDVDVLPNQPESKFAFSPDVTADTGSIGDIKRESSFKLDGTQADDRRPPDEELLKALGEPWAEKSQRLRKSSPFGSNPNWRLVSCIVKSRDQLRQEMFAQRLIQEFARIFDRANIPCWLRAYQIISTSSDSGLIETLTDSISIDSLKKHVPNVVTLEDYFVGRFGGRGSSMHKRAVRCFVQSMAGYSIIQYLLNIKDRHNGNIMIDSDGHVIHIDFGFLLSNSPGGNMEFEKSPFKLTNEMVQVMGGIKSGAFKLYKKLCVQGYVEAARYASKLLLMVDIAYPGNESMPCFLHGREYVLENLRERFGVDLSRKERAARMLKLIGSAHGNWTTKAYDQYQKVSLGISK